MRAQCKDSPYDKSPLDRCGKANTLNFDILSHEELTQMVAFACKLIVSVWQRVPVSPAPLPYPWEDHLVPKQQTYTASGVTMSIDSGSASWALCVSQMPALAFGTLQMVVFWR